MAETTKLRMRTYEPFELRELSQGFTIDFCVGRQTDGALVLCINNERYVLSPEQTEEFCDQVCEIAEMNDCEKLKREREAREKEPKMVRVTADGWHEYAGPTVREEAEFYHVIQERAKRAAEEAQREQKTEGPPKPQFVHPVVEWQGVPQVTHSAVEWQTTPVEGGRANVDDASAAWASDRGWHAYSRAHTDYKSDERL